MKRYVDLMSKKNRVEVWNLDSIIPSDVRGTRSIPWYDDKGAYHVTKQLVYDHRTAKNEFYRHLNVDKPTRRAINIYNDLCYKMSIYS